jgi:hypothetical protein
MLEAETWLMRLYGLVLILVLSDSCMGGWGCRMIFLRNDQAGSL